MTFNAKICDALKALHHAKRPIIILGAGVRLAGAGAEAIRLAETLGIPIAPTWAALDLVPYSHHLLVGAFGTHGTRAGNFAVQNADWILSIGSRLDSKATGTPPVSFAPNAVKFVVDVDCFELQKFARLGIDVTPIQLDAKRAILEAQTLVDGVASHDGSFPSFEGWRSRVRDWLTRYPGHDSLPYQVVQELSGVCTPDDVIVTDTGCAVAWVSQAFRFKEGQRFIHAWNQTPMGCGLPMAIGAYYATQQRVVLVTGDGGLMECVGELATVGRRRIPVKIVLLDNAGHGMCRQTQREWLGGEYHATSAQGGLVFPDWRRLFYAHDFAVVMLDRLEWSLSVLMRTEGPTVLIVPLDDEDVVPKVKFGHPNHNAHPLLPPDQIEQEMAA